MAQNPITEKRSKHIDIRYHFVRDKVDDGVVKLYWLEGNENPADMFTKNLAYDKFSKFRGQLGLTFKVSCHT